MQRGYDHAYDVLLGRAFEGMSVPNIAKVARQFTPEALDHVFGMAGADGDRAEETGEVTFPYENIREAIDIVRKERAND